MPTQLIHTRESIEDGLTMDNNFSYSPAKVDIRI